MPPHSAAIEKNGGAMRFYRYTECADTKGHPVSLGRLLFPPERHAVPEKMTLRSGTSISGSQNPLCRS